MNPTPEAAHGWLSFINRLGKTKFGAGVIGFAIASGVASLIFWLFVKDELKRSRDIPEIIHKVRIEEREFCNKNQDEQFQRYMRQQNEIIQNNANNRVTLEEVKMLSEQTQKMYEEFRKLKNH